MYIGTESQIIILHKTSLAVNEYIDGVGSSPTRGASLIPRTFKQH
jgi:hypothetical protein